MADKKISALTAATIPLVGTEVLPIVQSGATVKVAVADFTAGKVTTNANLTGDVTSVGNATTLTNAPVIAKVLTGYVSGAGVVAATDSILQAIQKLNGNDATNANLTGPITSVGNATSVASQTGTGSTFVMSAGPTISGNVTLSTENLVQGTAAKGINFIANTPAAGMTSQLLNWYEEGTWTPTTFTNWVTAPTISQAKYTRIGRLVTVNVFGLQGVSGADSRMSGLPFTSGSQGASFLIAAVGGTGVVAYGVIPDASTSIVGITAANFTGQFWAFSCTYSI